MKDKLPKSTRDEFFNHLVTVFGAPEKTLLTDNGREFSNEQCRSLCEQLKMVWLTTAAYSHFSISICESENALIKDNFKKVRSKFPSLDAQTCLNYACMAKISLFTHSDFTPAPIGLGTTPRLPNLREILFLGW